MHLKICNFTEKTIEESFWYHYECDFWAHLKKIKLGNRSHLKIIVTGLCF